MNESLITEVLNMLNTGITVKNKKTGKTYINNMEHFKDIKCLKNDIYTNEKENEYFQRNYKENDNYEIETYTIVTNMFKKVDKYGIDYLTKLPIRAKIVEYLDKISKTDDNYIIALIDIDNFKSINDTYGHDIGDRVLKEIAKVFKLNTKNNSFAGRYGGEEFLLIFKSDDLPKILNKLDLMRKKINSINFNANNEDFNISISIGISQFKSNEHNYNNKIKEADLALYSVKENGKNNIEVYHKDIAIVDKNVNNKNKDVN